jgi:hypothetical protein
VVDLHLRARAVVAWVHVLDYLRPALRRRDGLAVRACAVPGVDLRAGGHEAAGGHARVGDRGYEEVGVGAGEDVLGEVSNKEYSRRGGLEP